VFRPNLHSRRAAVFVRNVTESLDRPIDPIYIPGGLLSFVCYVTERLDRLLSPIYIPGGLRCLFAWPPIGGTKFTVLDRYSGADNGEQTALTRQSLPYKWNWEGIAVRNLDKTPYRSHARESNWECKAVRKR
jgi:hypothetical protein